MLCIAIIVSPGLGQELFFHTDEEQKYLNITSHSILVRTIGRLCVLYLVDAI